MEFQTLRRSHLKRNIIIGILVVGVISAVVLNFTRAKYQTIESIPLVNGTINYTPYDLKMVAMYQEEGGEYKSIDAVPTKGYNLNNKKSYCEVNDTKDNGITIEYQNGVINFLGMTLKGTRCYLYFDEQKTAKGTILLNNKVNEGTPNLDETSTTDEGLYKTEDDLGESYYFRGSVENNWVKFAGFYWRIIRINGDDSIRIIYSGSEASGPVKSGVNTQIGESAFNSSIGNNMYVGYMYQSNVVHGLKSNSTIKVELDKWYKNNLQNYTKYLALNAGFCNDREPSTDPDISNGQGGKGSSTMTYYGAYFRLLKTEGNKPTLKCKNESDLFTVSTASKGNKVLTYPIGLITADEVWYAGMAEILSSDDEPLANYLNTGQNYWTMTPWYYFSSLDYISILSINTLGGFNGTNYWADAKAGIRPVINLNSTVTLSGSGTINNPYIVEEGE